MYKLIFAALLCFGITTIHAQKAASTTDLVKIMNESDIDYKIGILEKKITRKDQSKNLTSNNYYQDDERGRIVVKQYTATTQEADRLLKEKNYAEASKAYMKVLNQNPFCAKAMTGLGQVHEQQGELDKAQEWLTKAVNQNFHDYKAHQSLANIYLKQKNKTKAAEEITIAHILNRNAKDVKQSLDKIYASTGKKVGAWEVVPQCEIKKVDAKTVEVNVQMDWFNYAIPMAARTHEPSLKGNEHGTIEVVKEGLIAMIPNLLRKVELQQKTEFKYLKKSMEEKQLGSYGYYEIVLVEEPEAAFGLSKETIERIGDYLMKTRSVSL